MVGTVPAASHLVPLIQDDVVPQDATALRRLQAEGVFFILSLISICRNKLILELLMG
jgi:hypothetical protein